jgi:hypothetical protein
VLGSPRQRRHRAIHGASRTVPWCGISRAVNPYSDFVGIVHRRRARLHNERPQFSKVLTPIVKIGEAIPWTT